MRISALDEYGIRCLLALARVGTDGQLSISEIAESEGLSVPYTSKLLAILRKAGLVSAVRGRKGGFQITRQPEEINLLEVLTALGGPLIDEEHCRKFSGQKDVCVHSGNCSVMTVLGGLAGFIAEYLTSTTIADVVNGDVLNQTKNIETRILLPTASTASGKIE